MVSVYNRLLQIVSLACNSMFVWRGLYHRMYIFICGYVKTWYVLKGSIAKSCWPAVQWAAAVLPLPPDQHQQQQPQSPHKHCRVLPLEMILLTLWEAKLLSFISNAFFTISKPSFISCFFCSLSADILALSQAARASRHKISSLLHSWNSK